MSPPASNDRLLSEGTSNSEDTRQSKSSSIRKFRKRRPPREMSEMSDSEDGSKSPTPKMTSQRCPTEGDEQDELSSLTDLMDDPAISPPPHPTSQPRLFPLSPPPLTQTVTAALDESVPPDPRSEDCNSESDDLPTVVEMLAKTHPSQKSIQARNSTRSHAKNPSSALSSKMDIDANSLTPTRPLKCQPTDSPRIPDPPTTSSAQKNYNVVKTPNGEYIEILTDTESPPPPLQVPLTITPTISHSQRPKPISKQKRKRALSESSTAGDSHTGGSSSTNLGVSASSHSRFLPKRTKLETASVIYRKHPVHWQLDGNVLVQAGAVRFKLQRSRLARQSIWFREAFVKAAKTLAPDDDVIFLDPKEVKLKDFEVLLDALDDAISFVYTQPSFRTMASILRASYALAFQAFEEWAMQFLQNMWSARLEDLTTDRVPFATETIILARRCKVPGVLRRAMYELVRLEGFGQDDPDDDDGDDLEVRKKKDEKQGLPTSVVAALVRGREKLTSMWMLSAASLSKNFEHCVGETGTLAPSGDDARPGRGTNSETLPTPTSSHEPSDPPNVCTTLSRSLSIQAHTKIVHTSGIFEDFHADPLCGLQTLIDAPWDEEGFCEVCVEHRQTIWRRERERAWDNLAIWFGLNEAA